MIKKRTADQGIFKVTQASIALHKRPRRNRRTAVTRDLMAQTSLHIEKMVFPIFLIEGKGQRIPIKSLPGLFRFSTDQVIREMKTWWNLGIRSFALFPAISENLKNPLGSEGLNKNGLFPKAIQEIKNKFPDAVLFTDIALDPYSSDGHDGLVKDGKILNDPTLEVLASMAILQAECGADYVAPSDMMDGRVGVIRQALDQSGFADVGIMSYSAKYASSFYGPFRDALSSAPKFGDKKTYQMDFRNSAEALREVQLDISEGADIVMVKPALCYLDIISQIKNKFYLPVAAYNVSGEYAMIKFAAQAGIMDEAKAMIESLTAIQRAGADMIFTYWAPEFARMKNDQ